MGPINKDNRQIDEKGAEILPLSEVFPFRIFLLNRLIVEPGDSLL